MGDDQIARRVVIHGRVQGVFFRDTLRSVARDAGVSGWAANRDDGTVQAVLEGPGDGVELVLGFCREGPEQARVDRVDVEETAVEGLTGFEIR